MKKFLIILLAITFTQELEVDGDLKVTGNIQAGTIDSLVQVIASLQEQVNNLPLIHRKVFEVEQVVIDAEGTYWIPELDFSLGNSQQILITSLICSFRMGGYYANTHSCFLNINDSSGDKWLIPGDMTRNSHQGHDHADYSQSTIWSENEEFLFYSDGTNYNFGAFSPPTIVGQNASIKIKATTTDPFGSAGASITNFKLEVFYTTQFIED